MRYLFVDNFRGFKKTLVPIADVNFLVGENSTGKTSLLNLLNLLQSRRFWLEQRFDVGQTELGSFNDIVSINASDRTYFRIGFFHAGEKKEENRETGCTAYLLTFKRGEGLPRVHKFSYIIADKQIHAKFGVKTLRYRFEDLPKVSDDSELVTIFERWTRIHEQDEAGYRQLARPEIPISDLREDLLSAIRATSDAISKKLGKRLPRSLFIPRPFEKGLTWLAPIRSTPKRTYDKYMFEFSPEGAHTPYLIRKLLTDKNTKKAFIAYLDRFGKNSRLFKSIAITPYGKTVTSPFELDIVLEASPLNIETVGYGISQLLPIIVELFARREDTWFAIQQPEIHLHPKAQVALGEIFAELAANSNTKFLIETHSDFTIDGFRLQYRKIDRNKKPTAQILFSERVRGENKLYPIAILENGELAEDQPRAYRDFFVQHDMRILRI